MRDFSNVVINQRRREKQEKHEDLLTYFINMEDEHGEILSDDRLEEIVLNFIIAGRDTTAQALVRNLFLLFFFFLISEYFVIIIEN